jgi:hypothetical protein
VILACWPRAAHPVEPAAEAPAAEGNLRTAWEPSQEHTDSWIWR